MDARVPYRLAYLEFLRAPRVKLPKMEKRQRVALERMVIRAFASGLHNKAGIMTNAISDYRLVNDKIDAGVRKGGQQASLAL